MQKNTQTFHGLYFQITVKSETVNNHIFKKPAAKHYKHVQVSDPNFGHREVN